MAMVLYLVTVNILLVMALEADENLPQLCSAANDYCPRGFYCSTTSHRCWPCHRCGVVDVAYHSIPTKCRCDGGKDGDPFLICGAFPYPGQTRGSLIYTLDDLSSNLKTLFAHYFDGKYAETNPGSCPYKHTTTTTVPLTTKVETSTSVRTATHHNSGYEAISSDLYSTSFFNKGCVKQEIEDNPQNLQRGMAPDKRFILAVAGAVTFLLVLILQLIYCSCRYVKPDQPINERVEVQQELEDDVASDNIETSRLYPVPLQNGSTTEVKIIEELPLAVTQDTVKEFSNEILSEVTWTQMKPLVQTAFEDKNFKREFLKKWLPAASEEKHSILNLVAEKDLYVAIKQETDIFGVDTYEAVGGALHDRDLRKNFPSQHDIIKQLINVLAKTDANKQRCAAGNYRQQPAMETIA